MAEKIDPIKLSQISELKEIAAPLSRSDSASGSIFDEILGRAIDALNDVSEVEFTADKLVDDYIVGRAELSDVMVATAKMTVAVQLAVTVITSTVNTFKEITQMQV